jgi:hypothetical protein
VSVIAGAVSIWVDKRIERKISDESVMINAYYFAFKVLYARKVITKKNDGQSSKAN